MTATHHPVPALRRQLVGLVVFAAALLGTPAARAESQWPALVPLADEKLAGLGPLLRTSDIALLEADSRGWQRQVTTLTLIAAPPTVVREVLIHPEHYGRFVRNMVESSVRPGPDGSIDHSWKLSYFVASFSGVNRYILLPPKAGEAYPPVEIVDPTGTSHYRWEFLPARSGGGTIVVLYGYTDVRHSGGFLDRVLARADTLEFGLALTTQMTLLLAMKTEAEKRGGEIPPFQPPAASDPAPSYQFLLDRGLVALLRRSGDRLSEVSMIERARARSEALLDEATHAERWSSYVPSISRSAPRAPVNGLPVVELEQALPLMSWTTQFGTQRAAAAVDQFGLAGDLGGARLRWDVRPDGSAERQQLILRAQVSFSRNSIIMRQLFKIEPLFEYGVNVGLVLVIMRAVRSRAEAATLNPPSLPVPRTG